MNETTCWRCLIGSVAARLLRASFEPCSVCRIRLHQTQTAWANWSHAATGSAASNRPPLSRRETGTGGRSPFAVGRPKPSARTLAGG